MDRWQGWKVEDEKENEIVEVISACDFAKSCGLVLLTGDENAKMVFATVNVNRPGLLLAGFEDYFAQKRIQVLGNAETYFLSKLSREENEQILTKLITKKIPCVIFSRGIHPTDLFLDIANKNKVPVFLSQKPTSELINATVSYLNNVLCEQIGLHGVLMDISGVGVLITGHSGMGKSETALELVHRGHKLVADDAVHIKRVNGKLIGTAPKSIRFFMEVRGIGIIDVRSMFGVGSVLYDREIDMVIELERWNDKKEYERLDSDGVFAEILGVNIPKLTTPVMVGRNLAIVVEVAARNFRLKKMGYNAKDELFRHQNFTSDKS